MGNPTKRHNSPEGRNRVFLQKYWLMTLILVKNPVSWVGMRPELYNMSKFCKLE